MLLSPLRPTMARLLAVVALVVLAGALVSAPATAQHRHDSPGLYDPGCPLVALAAVDRQSGVVVAVVSVPLVATTLAARPFVGPRAQAAAADVRFRAPPVR